MFAHEGSYRGRGTLRQHEQSPQTILRMTVLRTRLPFARLTFARPPFARLPFAQGHLLANSLPTRPPFLSHRPDCSRDTFPALRDESRPVLLLVLLHTLPVGWPSLPHRRPETTESTRSRSAEGGSRSAQGIPLSEGDPTQQKGSRSAKGIPLITVAL